jgi:hypothetical protein
MRITQNDIRRTHIVRTDVKGVVEIGSIEQAFTICEFGYLTREWTSKHYSVEQRLEKVHDTDRVQLGQQSIQGTDREHLGQGMVQAWAWTICRNRDDLD